MKINAKKLPSGQWRCQVMVDGKRRSFTAPTAREAEKLAAAYKSELLKADKTEKPKITLSQAIRQYCEDKANILSPATIRGYEITRRNRFKDLMQMEIRKITRDDVKRAINQEAALVSPKTVANAYGVIRPVLKEYGVDVFGLELPKKAKAKKEYLQMDEFSRFFEAVDNSPYKLPILLALWLGLRRSEVLGLCWDCVDLDHGTIEIRRAYVPNKENKWELKDMTKNYSSNRVLSCPPELLALFPPRGEDHERVCPYHASTLDKALRRISAQSGLTYTSLHGLRHTNAAAMLSAGVSTQYAQQRGGWAEERTMKQIYSYVFTADKQAADARIDDLFRSAMQKSQDEEERKKRAAAIDMMKHIAAAFDVKSYEVF